LVSSRLIVRTQGGFQTFELDSGVVILRQFLLGLALALSVGPTAAQEEVFGAGTVSCGTWTQARQARSIGAGAGAQWVAGYLSGLNVGTASAGRDALSGTDFDGLMGWIDNYCQAHPLDPLVTAAHRLMIALRARAGQ
jgi:hypothetical protein